MKDHPNVTKIVEFIEDPGNKKYHIISELQETGVLFSKRFWVAYNMHQNLDQGNRKVSTFQATRMIRDILSALQYSSFMGLTVVHDIRNVAHRDIKPDNIVFGSKLSLKLTDFGVSEQFADFEHIHTSSRSGTRMFHSPEQYIGKLIVNLFR